MAVNIWVSGRVVATIRIIKATTARRWVVINWSTSSGWRATISTTVIVIVITAGWWGASVAVCITTRAIWRSTTTTIIIGRWITTTARAWGAGPSSAVTRDIWLGICNTSDANTFEFTAVKLFYCSLKIRSSLELNKASFTISVATRLGVNNVKAGLTSEVFEVLYPESM